jgi:hypothetical protein
MSDMLNNVLSDSPIMLLILITQEAHEGLSMDRGILFLIVWLIAE